MKWRALVVTVGLLGVLLPHGPASGLPPGTRVEPYATGLAFSIDMAWDEGTDRIFYTEKNTGMVRVLVGGKVLDQPCVDLAVNSEGERGAGGLVLSPNFDRNRFLYVFYTNASPLVDRVTRFTVQNNRCTDPRHIVNGLSASGLHHHGAHLEIVGEKLLVSTGDQGNPAEAQDTTRRLGKILRYNLNGTVPADNPYGNAVWTYGLRNPYGIAHRPGTTQVFATDNGEDCDDEVNRIVRGGNQGWGPGYVCGTDGVGPDARPPHFRWSEQVAPTDATWYVGSMASLSDGLILGDYNNGQLHRFTFTSTGTAVTGHTIVYDHSGGIVDVSGGPGGWLYFMSPATSTIYRIMPS